MMDCSNPVVDSTRVSLAQMSNSYVLLKRQELSLLQQRAEGTPRKFLDSLPVRADDQQVEKDLAYMLKRIPASVESSSTLDLSFLPVWADRIPVCDLEYGGLPIHPPNVSSRKGFVFTQMIWGGMYQDTDLLRRVLKYVDPGLIEEAKNRLVFTRGIVSGFQNRLEKLLTRKCRSPMMSYQPALRTRATKKYCMTRLKTILPVDLTKLPCWQGDELRDLLDDVVNSKAASAGAPYHRAKGEVVMEMMEGILPKVVKALKEGTLQKLQNRYPELFVAMVGNKVDRLKVDKLDDKARPYFKFPWHWTVLWSFLSQGFTHALQTFDEPSTGSVNAYGFSCVGGGIQRVVDQVANLEEIEDGHYKLGVYGDDVDLYFRRRGVLYRISPDFSQMDGSVDMDTMSLVLEYIKTAFQAEYGENKFWEEVLRTWEDNLSGGLFMAEGEKVYRKPQKHGLLTGIVGTTLFDTAKAALSYDALMQYVYAQQDFDLLFDPDRVSTFFLDHCGLVIKEGTWVVTPFNVSVPEGSLLSQNKFLGIRYKAWAETDFYMDSITTTVPDLEFDEWLDNILTPREDPIKHLSATKNILGSQRLLFDRLRGLLVTGACFNEQTRRLIGGLINDLPPVAILMAVQTDTGRGATPEHVLLEGFHFPTSEGVPDIPWVFGLYAGQDRGRMPTLFPEMDTFLSDYKYINKFRKPLTIHYYKEEDLEDEDDQTPYFEYVEAQEEPPEVEPIFPGLLQPPAPFRTPPVAPDSIASKPSKPKSKNLFQVTQTVVDLMHKTGLEPGPARDFAQKSGQVVIENRIAEVPLIDPSNPKEVESLAIQKDVVKGKLAVVGPHTTGYLAQWKKLLEDPAFYRCPTVRWVGPDISFIPVMTDIDTDDTNLIANQFLNVNGYRANVVTNEASRQKRAHYPTYELWLLKMDDPDDFVKVMQIDSAARMIITRTEATRFFYLALSMYNRELLDTSLTLGIDPVDIALEKRKKARLKEKKRKKGFLPLKAQARVDTNTWVGIVEKEERKLPPPKNGPRSLSAICRVGDADYPFEFSPFKTALGEAFALKPVGESIPVLRNLGIKTDPENRVLNDTNGRVRLYREKENVKGFFTFLARKIVGGHDETDDTFVFEYKSGRASNDGKRQWKPKWKRPPQKRTQAAEAPSAQASSSRTA